MKRRYYNETEILRDIDKWKGKVIRLKQAADALDIRADQFVKAGPEHKEDVAYNREQAQKKRKAALRIEGRKLVQLKNKLAEFRTAELPTMSTGDKSIQAT